MTGREIYEIWAEKGTKWIEWVRPVPFVAINDEIQIYMNSEFIVPKVDYITDENKNSAIIVDMPNDESLEIGIALAKLGFRPIPVYNGTIEQLGSIATTDNKSVIKGLVDGAKILKKLEIKKDAKPAFLLDTNRLNRFKMDVSIFDNSWDIYSQDLPSGDYLLKNDINKVIVIGDKIQRDLKKILYKYQEKGIKILFTNEYENPKEIKIVKPKEKRLE